MRHVIVAMSVLVGNASLLQYELMCQIKHPSWEPSIDL
jgi:hypothetical protein